MTGTQGHTANQQAPPRRIPNTTSFSPTPRRTRLGYWAQLVLYRRGPEWPLSLATPKGKQGTAQVLRRTFAGFGDRPALSAGFIGRRLDQRQVRRRLRGGEHALVSRASGAWARAPWPGRCCPG